MDIDLSKLAPNSAFSDPKNFVAIKKKTEALKKLTLKSLEEE